MRSGDAEGIACINEGDTGMPIAERAMDGCSIDRIIEAPSTCHDCAHPERARTAKLAEGERQGWRE